MNPTRGRRNGGSSFLLVTILVAAAADIAAAQQSGKGPSYFDPQNFNPSMAVIIVVLVTAFFFLGFFSIYIRRCAGGPLGGPGEDLGARPGVGGIAFLTSGAARSRRMRGLDAAALEALPTMAYADVKAHKVGKGELECAVCLSEFDDDDTLRLLPKCSHAFHADCIDAWLASHVTCPVCRANLVPGADAPVASGAAAASATPERDDVAATLAPQPAEETPTAPPEQVTVVITDAAEETEEERVRREEAAELVRIGSVKRALRSKSGRSPAAQFPRSHTTGHSLAAAPAESAERYTLRLPEHVLREVVAAGKLRRTKSLQAFREGRAGGSTRRGSRSVRLGQSGRWPAITMSSFLGLSFSAWGSSRRGEAEAAGKGGAKVASDGTAAAEQQQCDSGACPLPLGGRRV
ncbi:hypothetical protein CFC21_082623 [Triticum aestivum]|uniref:RING-type E3 ubiquitin transferase n=3 Tax=Triticum TaxID=4564 RepID=A0A9R0XVM8_TRITD|nr:E3 ubiquitin-protein ligase ATL6-like [Triticum aestivum]XP_048534614.1 E3 ubiquitin-protein ligase ATL6-like [Triticum urartu]KAF7078147.1 hypothetical protein CFC21_082623 [Triticum aestivum]VAI43888.1 unnamed protein product [Triticum turgidum subsp. durum]